MGIVATPLPDGRYRLGDEHGDLIDYEPITEADVEARERALAKRAAVANGTRAGKQRHDPVKGHFTDSAPARDAIAMLVERGFTQTEISGLAEMSGKRVSEIASGKQRRVRQGTVDKLTKLVIDAVTGKIAPASRRNDLD